MREYQARLNPKGVIKMEAVYSRFSMRMRIAAISLLMVFFSQQVSWACAGNLSLLVNLPPSPLIYQDHGEFNRLVAKRVYSLVKPSFRDKAQELKSAYQWLKTPSTQTVPCSAYVLYNLLQAKGIKPKIEDISTSLISLDLKTGNLKPPFTASRIDNSLYALAKTAENQGILLYPFRLNAITPELLNSLNSQTPFIAHLNYSEALDKGHFVLVTGIDADKVHFFYDKGDTFLPLDKFLEEFSGYCLLSSASIGDRLPVVSDAEAQGVLGAKSYKGVRVDYTKLFKEPSTKDLLIGFGVSVGTMFGGSMLSGMMKGQGLSFGKAFAGFGAGIAQSEISKASVNFSVQQFKMKPLYAQIVGYGVSGAMSGAIAGIGNNGQFKIGDGDNFWNKHSIMRGAIMGTVQGGMQGTGSVMAYQGIKNTSFYKKNPFIARQVAGLVGGAVGYMGFYAMTGAMRMNVNIDKNNNEVFGKKQESAASVTYSDGSARYRISSGGMEGGVGVFNNVKLALADSSFLSSMISQGTALGVEWAAGPKYAKYSRILGQGIGSVAGGYATGNGISPWKMMMSGALSGGISLGLGYLGGEIGPDGKNKLGLTDIQMAGIEWLGTATLYSGIGAVMSMAKGNNGFGTFRTEFVDSFNDFSKGYVTFGGTSPLYTQGAGGWSSFMYNQKIADFGGFANYKANADYSMKLQGYKSWSKFVDDGKAANLLPSFSNSLVRYASSSLHHGAVDNVVKTIELTMPLPVTNVLGINKRRVESVYASKLTQESIASLYKKISEAKDDKERNSLKEQLETLKEDIKLSEGINDAKKELHIGIVTTQANGDTKRYGKDYFALGGMRVGYENDNLILWDGGLRKELDARIFSGREYNLGHEAKANDLESLSGTTGALLRSTDKPEEAVLHNAANFKMFAQDYDGKVHWSVGVRQAVGGESKDYYVGRVSNTHEKGKPTITDIFTSQKVTPKKFWFDKKININTGITMAVYNRQIATNEGLKYLVKNKAGLYPAAGFGYSESGGIVTKDGKITPDEKGEFDISAIIGEEIIKEQIAQVSKTAESTAVEKVEHAADTQAPTQQIHQEDTQTAPDKQKVDKKQFGVDIKDVLNQRVDNAKEAVKEAKVNLAAIPEEDGWGAWAKDKVWQVSFGYLGAPQEGDAETLKNEAEFKLKKAQSELEAAQAVANGKSDASFNPDEKTKERIEQRVTNATEALQEVKKANMGKSTVYMSQVLDKYGLPMMASFSRALVDDVVEKGDEEGVNTAPLRQAKEELKKAQAEFNAANAELDAYKKTGDKDILGQRVEDAESAVEKAKVDLATLPDKISLKAKVYDALDKITWGDFGAPLELEGDPQTLTVEAKDRLDKANKELDKARTNLNNYGKTDGNNAPSINKEEESAPANPVVDKKTEVVEAILSESTPAQEEFVVKTTRSIKTPIIIDNDALFELSSRDNPQSFPVMGGKSNFVVTESLSNKKRVTPSGEAGTPAFQNKNVPFLPEESKGQNRSLNDLSEEEYNKLIDTIDKAPISDLLSGRIITADAGASTGVATDVYINIGENRFDSKTVGVVSEVNPYDSTKISVSELGIKHDRAVEGINDDNYVKSMLRDKDHTLNTDDNKHKWVEAEIEVVYEDRQPKDGKEIISRQGAIKTDNMRDRFKQLLASYDTHGSNVGAGEAEGLISPEDNPTAILNQMSFSDAVDYFVNKYNERKRQEGFKKDGLVAKIPENTRKILKEGDSKVNFDFKDWKLPENLEMAKAAEETKPEGISPSEKNVVRPEDSSEDYFSDWNTPLHLKKPEIEISPKTGVEDTPETKFIKETFSVLRPNTDIGSEKNVSDIFDKKREYINLRSTDISSPSEDKREAIEKAVERIYSDRQYIHFKPASINQIKPDAEVIPPSWDWNTPSRYIRTGASAATLETNNK